MGVAHGIGQLHLFAALEHRFGVMKYLRVKAVRNGIAATGYVEASLVVVGIDLCQNRVEVEIVEMFGAATDLTQQFGAADDFIKRLAPKSCEDFTHFLGNESHQIDNLFGRARKFGT